MNAGRKRIAGWAEFVLFSLFVASYLKLSLYLGVGEVLISYSLFVVSIF